MAEPGVLTLAYVSAHPVDAARVLESLHSSEAAELFARLPARAAAPALGAMLPPLAARVVAALDDERTLALLSAAGAQVAVAILRHIPEPRRSRLLNGLSTTTAVVSRMLLGYADDTVGAWADPEMLALPGTTAVAEALARARADRDAEASELYIVGDAGRLEGVVALADLLRAPPTASIGSVSAPPGVTMPASMPLVGALAHPAWQRTSILPVVERGERLIGTVRLSSLHDAVSQGTTVRRGSEGETTLAGAAAASYWSAVSGLVQSGLQLMPGLKPVLPEER